MKKSNSFGMVAMLVATLGAMAAAGGGVVAMLVATLGAMAAAGGGVVVAISFGWSVCWCWMWGGGAVPLLVQLLVLVLAGVKSAERFSGNLPYNP
jgi:hypothetical protein